ncbi:hypothetical protein JL720_2521 [Aureococcus anophagefferens]|nr:hypothetical protein JL720_2521 [Aureococcus anophagefferens]
MDAVLARVDYGPAASRVRHDASAALAHLLLDAVASFGDCGGSPALALVGTVAMTYRGHRYNLPVEIVLPPGYPAAPPRVFLRPTPDMSVRDRHRHVDAAGAAYLPLLSVVAAPPGELVATVSDVFGADPPLFARPPGAAPAAAAAAARRPRSAARRWRRGPATRAVQAALAARLRGARADVDAELAAQADLRAAARCRDAAALRCWRTRGSASSQDVRQSQDVRVAAGAAGGGARPAGAGGRSRGGGRAPGASPRRGRRGPRGPGASPSGAYVPPNRRRAAPRRRRPPPRDAAAAAARAAAAPRPAAGGGSGRGEAGGDDGDARDREADADGAAGRRAATARRRRRGGDGGGAGDAAAARAPKPKKADRKAEARAEAKRLCERARRPRRVAGRRLQRSGRPRRSAAAAWPPILGGACCRDLRELVPALRDATRASLGDETRADDGTEYFFEHAQFAVSEFVAEASQRCEALARGTALGFMGRARRSHRKGEVVVEEAFGAGSASSAADDGQRWARRLRRGPWLEPTGAPGGIVGEMDVCLGRPLVLAVPAGGDGPSVDGVLRACGGGCRVDKIASRTTTRASSRRSRRRGRRAPGSRASRRPTRTCGARSCRRRSARRACSPSTTAPPRGVEGLNAAARGRRAAVDGRLTLVQGPPGTGKTRVACAARSAYDAKMALVRDADVVCATCVGAGADLLDRFHFDRVLVDEAAQATEPVCVVPLCVEIKSSTRLQLPHAPVLGVANDAVYAGRLCDGVHPRDRALEDRVLRSVGAAVGAEGLAAALPFALVHVPGASATAAPKSNDDEAAAVARAVGACLAGGLAPADIAVLSPYSAQVRAVRRAPNAGVDCAAVGLEVSSVDAIQGREKEVVILSTRRCASPGDVRTLAADPEIWRPFLSWALAAGVANRGAVEALRGEKLAYDLAKVRTHAIRRTPSLGADYLPAPVLDEVDKWASKPATDSVFDDAYATAQADREADLAKIASSASLVSLASQQDSVKDAWDDSDSDDAGATKDGGWGDDDA